MSTLAMAVAPFAGASGLKYERLFVVRHEGASRSGAILKAARRYASCLTASKHEFVRGTSQNESEVLLYRKVTVEKK